MLTDPQLCLASGARGDACVEGKHPRRPLLQPYAISAKGRQATCRCMLSAGTDPKSATPRASKPFSAVGIQAAAQRAGRHMSGRTVFVSHRGRWRHELWQAAATGLSALSAITWGTRASLQLSTRRRSEAA